MADHLADLLGVRSRPGGELTVHEESQLLHIQVAEAEKRLQAAEQTDDRLGLLGVEDDDPVRNGGRPAGALLSHWSKRTEVGLLP